MPTLTATAPRCSRAPVPRRGNSSRTSMSGRWGSTCQSPCPSPCSPSRAPEPLSPARTTSMASRACSSTPTPRPSPRSGRMRRRRGGRGPLDWTASAPPRPRASDVPAVNRPWRWGGAGRRRRLGPSTKKVTATTSEQRDPPLHACMAEVAPRKAPCWRGHMSFLREGVHFRNDRSSLSIGVKRKFICRLGVGDLMGWRNVR
mmetsp:Transcript_807/g.2877  ORF Transcript_807/g.2877 Transcript_807/m.2877 type:complete len:202 (-) Transcript_807:11-616(-)